MYIQTSMALGPALEYGLSLLHLSRMQQVEAYFTIAKLIITLICCLGWSSASHGRESEPEAGVAFSMVCPPGRTGPLKAPQAGAFHPTWEHMGKLDCPGPLHIALCTLRYSTRLCSTQKSACKTLSPHACPVHMPAYPCKPSPSSGTREYSWLKGWKR